MGAKEAAEKARKEKEAKEAAEKARKEQEAKAAAEKARREKEAKEAAEKARQKEEEEEAARVERERIRDHYAERQRKAQEEEKIVIKPADLSQRGRKGPVDEDDIEPVSADMSFQESPEDKDNKVKEVVRHLLQEVKITINLKTLKHHIDHIFMIRLGSQLKAGTLTMDKYVRLKNNDRRVMRELVALTTERGYDETDDVFGTLDKALKIDIARSSKDADDQAVQEQVAQLLKQTRVPVSQKDFVYHMNKIITIILGMMLHVGVLTFTKFHQMKCAHRADMEDMVSSSYYDPNADVFGVLERAIDKHHKVTTPTQ